MLGQVIIAQLLLLPMLRCARGRDSSKAERDLDDIEVLVVEVFVVAFFFLFRQAEEWSTSSELA